MRSFVWGFAAFTGLLFGAPKEVTFHKTVEPILQARCQGCHRPGEAAPMSLMSYQEARPWAKAMKNAVLQHKMPPWFADAAHGTFSNDRRLAQEEIDALVAWADGGAKEGDAKDAPAPKTFAEGWSIGKPDVVLSLPAPFEVPASGTVEYTYFVVPTGFTEDKWIERVEARAGNRAIVHHAVIFVRPPGVRFLPDAKAGAPYVPEKQPQQGNRKPDTGAGSFQYTGAVEIAGAFAPGSIPLVLEPGQARMIPKGSDLIFQMHYTTNGKAGTVNFRIPPQEGDFPVHAKVKLYEDATLLSLFPHMHVRGKSFEYRATYPTGETEVLLSVPKYDFNWQLGYNLTKPKLLPKGTVIECIAHYDNSPNNPANPDPTKEVFWGDQTWEEMLAGFMDIAMPVNVTMRDIAAPKKPAAAGPAN